MVSVTLTISFLQPPNSNDITVLLIHSEQWFTKCGSQTSRKGDVITRNADPQATHQIYWTRSWFSPRCLNKPTRWSWRTPRWDTTHVRMLLQTRIPEWVAMSSSRGSSQPRDRTDFFTIWASTEPKNIYAQEQRQSYLVYYPEYFFNWERRGNDTKEDPNVKQTPAMPFIMQSPIRCIRIRNLNMRRWSSTEITVNSKPPLKCPPWFISRSQDEASVCLGKWSFTNYLHWTWAQTLSLFFSKSRQSK